MGLKCRSIGCSLMSRLVVDRREIAQLDGVVAAHRVAAFEALVAEQIGQPVGQHVEVDGAVVMVEEEGVVERRRLAGEPQVVARRADAVQDQVGEDGLFLLPPRLAVVPREAVKAARPASGCAPRRRTSRRAAGRCHRRHRLGDLPRQRDVFRLRLERLFMRIRFQAIFRLWPTTARFCCQPQRLVVATSPRGISPARTGCSRSPGSAARSCRRCPPGSPRSALRRWRGRG